MFTFIRNKIYKLKFMKKAIIASLVVMGFFVSCKKEKTEEGIPVVPEAVAVEEIVSEECYRLVLKKDTISMTLKIKGKQLSSGKLSYKFFEKDKSEGTLIGEIKGDTLFADYTFMSEGISSVRQLAFLKKGNDYIEGHGDIVDKNKGKGTLKDTKPLQFDGTVVLTKVDCKM